MYVDNVGFISLYDKNINGNYDNVKDQSYPKIIDMHTISCLGYKFKVRSTIFRKAVSQDVVKGWNIIFNKEKNENIIRAYTELEIINETNKRNGYGSVLYPILELLKLCYWCENCSKIEGFNIKLREIIRQIQGKSILLSKYCKVSEASAAYSDLLNSTKDFYSELMFASILEQNGNHIRFDNTSDLILNYIIGQVKTIHDKIIYSEMEENSIVAYLSGKDGDTLDKIKEFVSIEIYKLKWIDHLINAIRRKGSIILINAPQSLNHKATIFIHENQLQKENEKILSAINEYDSGQIPVLVLMECIFDEFITTFFIFKVPIINSKNGIDLDVSKFSKEYIKNTLIFAN